MQYVSDFFLLGKNVLFLISVLTGGKDVYISSELFVKAAQRGKAAFNGKGGTVAFGFCQKVCSIAKSYIFLEA